MRKESERAVLRHRRGGRRRYVLEYGALSGVSDPVTVTALTTPAGRPCYYPADAVLTEQEVAEVLALSVKTLRRLPIVVTRVSQGRTRYLYGDVLAYLKARRTG